VISEVHSIVVAGIREFAAVDREYDANDGAFETSATDAAEAARPVLATKYHTHQLYSDSEHCQLSEL